jgi:hypothetical protein
MILRDYCKKIITQKFVKEKLKMKEIEVHMKFSNCKVDSESSLNIK